MFLKSKQNSDVVVPKRRVYVFVLDGSQSRVCVDGLKARNTGSATNKGEVLEGGAPNTPDQGISKSFTPPLVPKWSLTRE